MNQKIVIGIIILILILVAILAFRQQTYSPDDKKINGDTMTEQAVDNVLSGRKPMEGQELPNSKPKPNNIQGSESSMRGDVIIEGTPLNDFK
jgi:hypothetical protein